MRIGLLKTEVKSSIERLRDMVVLLPPRNDAASSDDVFVGSVLSDTRRCTQDTLRKRDKTEVTIIWSTYSPAEQALFSKI